MTGARAPRHRGESRVPGWLIGLAFLLLLAGLSVLAWTKELPFTGGGFELKATFENAATLRSDAPVRIAGVNVGKVTGVEAKGDAAEVTFTVKEEGLPIHSDADVEIRPRLFLGGNFFLDVRPGSPSAPELEDGGSISASRTSTAVQLDEILTALQSNSRRDLHRLLEGFGTALTYEPNAAADADQDPGVRGETAARSLNDTFRYGGPAGRDSAIVAEALRGQTPGDLFKLISAQRRVLGELASREEDLQGLVSNFNVTTGALAAESANLSATLRELAPTLEVGEPSLRHLSDSLPPLRAFARELEPSTRELPATIRASGPWLDQTSLLLRDEELGGLANLLVQATPLLAATTNETTALFPELERTGRCVSEVLVPAAETPIQPEGSYTSDYTNGEPNYREFFYGVANIAGEGASFDGNGIYLRVNPGGGDDLAQTTNPDPTSGNTKLFSNAIDPQIGTMPPLNSAGPPPFNTKRPCHQNPVPAINGPAAVPGAPSPADMP